MTLLARIQEFFLTQGLEKNYWIAYSGGLDSHVLLTLCLEARQSLPLQLRVIHINHQLSPHAHAWAKQCEDNCKLHSVEFHQKKVEIDLKVGDSLEEKARLARYAVFAECLAKNDVLLTAHHQDDQAETMLLQLLRGAGPNGLAAMPSQKTFANGIHARPLLSFSRDELHQYAIQQELTWIEDESNANTKLSRNYIRHEILPLLKKHWPAASATMARSALHCAESQMLLETFAQCSMQDILGSQPGTLSISKLLLQPIPAQRLFLRLWIKQQGSNVPNTKKLETIMSNVLMASIDSAPCVAWADVEVRRYRDDLFLLKALSPFDLTAKWEWNLNQSLTIAGVGTLHATMGEMGLRADLGEITVGFRQGGEVVNLPNRKRHTLKNLFQEWGVPPWLRDRIPLLFFGDKCIAAIGYFIDPDFLAPNGLDVSIV